MAFSIGNKVINQTWAGTSTASVTISLSAGSILLLSVHQVGTLTGSTTPQVSSISSLNLAGNYAMAPGAKRSRLDTNIGAGTPHQTGELWAVAAGVDLTNEAITVTSTSVPINGTINAIECKGLTNLVAPFDPNASLAVGNDGHGTTATLLGVSTDTQQPIGLWLGYSTIDTPGVTVPGTWTGIQAAGNLATGGTNSLNFAAFQIFSGAQSNATWGSGSGTSRNWMALGTAFRNGPVKGPPGGFPGGGYGFQVVNLGPRVVTY